MLYGSWITGHVKKLDLRGNTHVFSGGGGVDWLVAGWRVGWAEFMLPNDTSVKDSGTFICFGLGRKRPNKTEKKNKKTKETKLNSNEYMVI